METEFDENSKMSIESLTDLISSKMGIALYFPAPNCGICTSLKPKIRNLIYHKFPKMEFVEISADVSPKIAAYFGVFSGPTLLVFIDGKESLRFVRNLSLVEFEYKLNRVYSMLF